MDTSRVHAPSLGDDERSPTRPASVDAPALERVRDLCLQLYQLAPVGYLMHDLGGRILEANYTVGVMLGLSADRLRGENLKRFVAREDVASFASHLSRVAFEDARCKLELRMQRPNGARFFATFESVPLAGTEGATILTVVLDTTVHRQMHGRLLEQQATCEAILQASSDALVGVDEQGAIRSFNASAERIFGHRARDVVGRHVGLLFDVSAPPLPCPASGQNARSTRAVRKDGTSFDAEVRVVRVAGASYTVVSIIDVSPRRAVARGQENAQRPELAGRLASSIAHDANNLLMTIASSASRIADAADDPTAIRERVAELRRVALGGAAIVRRLARMMGRAPGASVEVELDGALDRLCAGLGPMLPDGVDLVLELGASGSMVSLETGRLEQLVFNLLVNAQQAMPRGGTIAIATARIDSPLGVRLTISDTGVGMSAETRARALDGAFTTKEHGSGMGLSTVRTIVEQARGSIAIESEPGAGSRFVIELPEVRHDEQDVVPVARAGTLLLVEGDTLVRSTLRAYLEGGGHTVIEAADPREALERSRAERTIDALLTARTLVDGTRGLELAAQIRSIHPRTAVLIVCEARETLVRGQLAPNTLLLPHPCSERELRLALLRVLGPAGANERSRPLNVLLVEDDGLNRRMLGELLRKRGYAVELAATVTQAIERHRAGPSVTDVLVADAHLPDGTLFDLVAGVRSGEDDPALVVMSGLGPADDAAIEAVLAQPRTAFIRKPCAVDDVAGLIEQLGVRRSDESGMTRA